MKRKDYSFIKCDSCNGSGILTKVCRVCNGIGMINATEKCKLCWGTGKYVFIKNKYRKEDLVCMRCKGKGGFTKITNINIKNPLISPMMTKNLKTKLSM